MAWTVEVEEVKVPAVPAGDLLSPCLCWDFGLGLGICLVVCRHLSAVSAAVVVVALAGAVMPILISISVPKVAPAPNPVHTDWNCGAGGHRIRP